MRYLCAFALLLLTGLCSAQSFTVVHTFTFDEAYNPMAEVTFDRNGTLYGTTLGGVSNGSALYAIDSTGTEKVLRFFASKDGVNGGAESKPLLDSQGNIYGTTVAGGPLNLGTVWRLNSSGKLDLLWSWGSVGDASLGSAPTAGLVRDKAGNLYGTTVSGGPQGRGTAYKISRTTGAFSVLHYFGPSPDGCGPNGELLLAQDGNLYGIAPQCGALGYGALFKLDPATGAETILYNFTNGTDGGLPSGNLIQDPDGNFYGVTWQGGAYDNGTIYKFNATTSTLMTLYAFGTVPDDGRYSYAGLTRDPAGNLYGTSFSGGGALHQGTIFELTASGIYHILHRFRGNDGYEPYAGLTLHQGSLYGVTTSGGDPFCQCGVVFKMTP